MEVDLPREDTTPAIEQATRARMRNGERIDAEISDASGQEENPWLATAGLFADDPDLEGILRDIYAARDAENAPLTP